MQREVIVLCPVRNEEHNLRRMLPTWELFADHIVVADQKSDDATRDVLAASKKVTVVDNDAEYDEAVRARLLLEAARNITQHGIFVYMDADETLSANVLDSPEWTAFLRQPS